MDWQTAFWTLLAISLPAFGTTVAAIVGLRTDRNGYKLSYEREKARADQQQADQRDAALVTATATRVIEGLDRLMSDRQRGVSGG